MLIPSQPLPRQPCSCACTHTWACKPKHHCVHSHACDFPAPHLWDHLRAHAHTRRWVPNTWAPSNVRGYRRVPPWEPCCGLGTHFGSVKVWAGVFALRVPAPSLGWAGTWRSCPHFAKVGAGMSWRHVSKPPQQHCCSCASGRELGVSASSQHGHPPPGWIRSPLAMGRFSIFLGSIAALPVSC